jgi:tryptophanyl-tRNA synthetase
MTRLIARRFNERFAAGAEVFPAPDALLSNAPLLLGVDGTKMSKSRGNAVELRDNEDRTAQLIRRAKTDSERTISYEPHRRPEVASLLLIAALCTGRAPQDLAEEIGGRGAAALKALVAEAINEYLRPLRQRRQAIATDPGYLRQILLEGNARADQIAEQTLQQVRAVMDMTY